MLAGLSFVDVSGWNLDCLRHFDDSEHRRVA